MELPALSPTSEHLSSDEVSHFQDFLGLTCQHVPWSGKKDPEECVFLLREMWRESLPLWVCSEHPKSLNFCFSSFFPALSKVVLANFSASMAEPEKFHV